MSAAKPKRRKPATKAKRNRATPPDEKAAKIEAVLTQLAQHGNTSRACREAGLERTRFMHLVNEDADLAHKYARAKESGIEAAFDDLDKTAEEIGDVARARLVVDTRKWMLARMAPKKYGDRIEQHHTADDGLKAALADRLAQAQTAEARDLDDAGHT